MYRGKRIAKEALSYFFLIALAIVMLFPLVWLVFAPFKTNQQIFSSASLLPDSFSFDAYAKGWKGTAGFTYTDFFKNSFTLTVPVVLLTLVSSTLTGYGFARFRFRGKKFLKMVLISTLMLPGTTLVVPRYILFTRFGLTNSYAAFYVPAALGCTPFFTYQILQYFRGLPYELDESARIDGCNSFSLLLRILLPLCTPSLCAMGLFQFMWTWNDYFNVMVIDDGWQPNACDGPWNVGNERFPDMKGLADAIRARGARPGIWIRFLRDAKRETPCIEAPMRMENNPDNLDPSHPRVLKKVAEDTKRIVETWGYELIKHDFSTYDIFNAWGMECKGFMAADGWGFFDQSKTTAEIIIAFYKTIQDATQGKALILGCNVIGHLGAGLIHINRTGDDTSGVEWERTRKMGVNTLACRMLHHGAFYAADADCVGITGAIDWSLNREWMRALSVSGTPLFVSCKPGVLDDNASRELQQAFMENEKQQNELIPFEWMETVCPSRWTLNGQEISFHWFAPEGCPLP